MKLYHITSDENAILIAKNGFKDNSGSYGVVSSKAGQSKVSVGVFLSDRIFEQRRRHDSDCVFVLDIPEKEIEPYEWKEEIKNYREWCIPAKIINKYFINRKAYSSFDSAFYDEVSVKIPFDKLGSMTRNELITALKSK